MGLKAEYKPTRELDEVCLERKTWIVKKISNWKKRMGGISGSVGMLDTDTPQ